MKKQIYLDYAGATPLNSKVKKEMAKCQSSYFANAGAIHILGDQSSRVIIDSRKKIAKFINAHEDEIIFAGSGTESIALAILGLIKNYKLRIKNFEPHIVTTNIEHSAVLENCKNVTIVPVEENGIVDPKKIRDAIQENTVLVSVGYANNEIGTIQPIQKIAKEIRHYRKEKQKINKEKVLPLIIPRQDLKDINFPLFHTDACQAMNYLEINNIEKLGVDLMSFNSSKIYGPKGVGVLYKKRGLELNPLYNGGGQEFGLRSGTENVVGIVGVAEALEQVCKIKNKEVQRLKILRDYTINKLEHSDILKNVGIKLNGDRKNRLPNNINISVSGISSELLVIELSARGIYVSEKSACHSQDEGISHVIKALREAEGDSSKKFENSLRISLGQKTTQKDMDYFVFSLEKILEKYDNF